MISREYCKDGKGSVPVGSVIFPKRGAAIMTNKVRIAGRRLLLDSNMMALIPVASQIDSEFLYYLLLHEQLHKIADTSTIPQINNKHIIPYKALIPPVFEQRIISKMIGTWDQAIDLTESLIAAKQKRRKWLMQRLLTGKFGLLVLTSHGKKSGLEKFLKKLSGLSNGMINIYTALSVSGAVLRDYF